jgi:sugar phosphate isomerase/epimerase
MRISISNIAWDAQDDAEVARLLHRYSVNAIDVAPTKYFSDPLNAKAAEIALVKDWWNVRGIEITGMQSLLFGTSGLNIFASSQSRSRMLQHLDCIFRIGAGLGANRLVFGSPKNRDRSGISDEDVCSIATSFFRKVGDIAEKYGITLCLEPNPACYGANYMLNHSETALVVQEINHSSIKMQFDSGALTIAGEDPSTVLGQYSDLIGHVHVSEPSLLPLGDGNTNHSAIRDALLKSLPDSVVCIEMLSFQTEPSIVSIERALHFATNVYRDSTLGTKI